MQRFFTRLFLAMLLLSPATGFSKPETTKKADNPAAESRAPKASALMGEKNAADLAVKRHGGEVLSIDNDIHKGVPVYRIKLLLPSSRVKIIRLNAITGETI